MAGRLVGEYLSQVEWSCSLQKRTTTAIDVRIMCSVRVGMSGKSELIVLPQYVIVS